MSTQQVHALLERGVVVHRPEAVEIAPEVRPERLAPGVVLHTGCKLAGAATSIGPGCVLGAETPMTVVDVRNLTPSFSRIALSSEVTSSSSAWMIA